MVAVPDREVSRRVDRYVVHGEIAAGGMATVHWGRLLGTAGFSRTVAIKRLHPQFAKDPEFVAMFLDEAHVAARVRHPNVAPTLDVVSIDGELFIVMEYMHGETLARLLRPVGERKHASPPPPRIAAAIVSGLLHGLHAAHEATNDQGEPLGIVHRDVSPQNVLVGVDGVARVLDFGIAKARDRVHITRGGIVKGKVAYMSPEQLRGAAVDRRADVYAAGVILWEALVGRRLFDADGEFATADRVKAGVVDPPSRHVASLPQGYDELVLRAVAKRPEHRFSTAREMATALEGYAPIATASEVGAWVESRAGSVLELRTRQMKAVERRSEERVRVGREGATASDQPTMTRVLQAEGATVEIDPDGIAPTLALDLGAALPAAATSPRMTAGGAPPSTRDRRWLLFGGAGAAAVVCAGVVLFSAHARAPVMEQAAVPSSSGASVADPSSTAALPSEAPAPAELPSDQLPGGGTPSSAVSTARPRPAGHAPAAPARPRCNPPYVLDARGIRHLKPECL